jgi:Fe-S oxidoreductase
MCRFACPVALAEARETVTPAKKMEFLYLVGKGYRKIGPEIVEPIYKCTGCLHCFTYCGHKNMIMHVYYSARNELKNYADEKIKNVVEKYKDNYLKTGNAFGERSLEKFRELQRANRTGKTGVLFFPGCTEANFYPETTNRIFKFLRKIYPDLEFIQGEHYCCGFPLLNTGLMEQFLDNARKIMGYLNKFKIVLTNCPACATFLKNVYAGAGIILKPEVLTVLELISNVLDKVGQSSEGKSAVYHDPCYLTRYNRIITEPRKILKKIGFAITEFAWNGIDTECCGASVSSFFPELSRMIAKRRLSQIDDSTYSQYEFVTACPSCRRQFSKIMNKDVLDVSDEFVKKVV